MRWLMLGFVTVALGLTAGRALAHEGTEITVSGDVRPDGEIKIEGEEFEAGDEVRIELRRGGAAPVELGQVRADGEGAFEVSLHVPAAVEPGIYQLAAEGEESVEVQVTVLEQMMEEGEDAIEPEEETQSVSSDRPTGEVIGLAALTAAFAILGLALMWLSRARPRPVA